MASVHPIYLNRREPFHSDIRRDWSADVGRDGFWASQQSSLPITSEGTSLKQVTRNFPQRTSDSAIAPDMTTKEISDLYTAIGKKLTSPYALAGSINLASVFTQKADKVKHWYKNKLFLGAMAFISACAIIGIALIITADQSDPDRLYFMILMLGPAVAFSIVAAVVYRILPACTRTLQLRGKLEAMEEYLELCQISNEQCNLLFEEVDFGACDYRIVGSAGDGFGFFPSQGSNKHLFQNEAALTQDIDMNIFLNTFKDLGKDNLISIPGAKGFTWIKMDEAQRKKVADPVLLGSLEQIPGRNEYYISAAKISRVASGNFSNNPHANMTVIEHFPALTVKASAEGPNGTQEYEVDYAFAMRYPEWPAVAAEWITRVRYGVDPATVRHIASRGCYLVHKACGQNRVGHHHDFDWRYTFASAEADLFHYHRHKRALRLAFVILKFIIKLSMKRPGDIERAFMTDFGMCVGSKDSRYEEIPVLRTYHLKTVFLWMAEEDTDLDYCNIKGNETLGKVFLAMLDRYIGYVDTGFLPNYFMGDRNMLSGDRYKREHFTNALKLLKEIRSQPTNVITWKFERQFINKKSLMKAMIVLMGVAIVAIIISFASNLSSAGGSKSSASLNTDWGRYISDISSNKDTPPYQNKTFTAKYLTFLQELYSGVVNSNV